MKWLHSVHTGKNRSTHSGARGLAWPILGGWGPSDPSSNLGGPTQVKVPQQPAMPIQQITQ